eukprot:5461474-Pleurochrysis_carterae.AAC.3
MPVKAGINICPHTIFVSRPFRLTTNSTYAISDSAPHPPGKARLRVARRRLWQGKRPARANPGRSSQSLCRHR